MNSQKLYENLIEVHINKGYLRDKSLKDKILEIPIYELIEDKNDLKRYLEKDKPIFCYFKDKDDFRTVTAPHMISVFLSMLELSNKDEVLMLGSKGGFIESILSNIVKNVYVLEEHPEVAKITEDNIKKLQIKNIRVINKNPLKGLKDLAPFDKILVSGAVEKVPENIFAQLKPYGLLVAPIIVSDEKQQVIQYVKKSDEIEEVDFGGVQFQELYHSKIEYTPEKLKAIKGKDQSFLDVYANLPQIQILDLGFNSEFAKKDNNLNMKDPSYRIYCRIKNNSSKEQPIQVKLEMPSLNKENLPIKIKLKPGGEEIESLIISNAEKEGKHDFNLIVCDEENFRLDKVESSVEIKQSKFKKAIEITLIILKISMKFL